MRSGPLGGVATQTGCAGLWTFPLHGLRRSSEESNGPTYISNNDIRRVHSHYLWTARAIGAPCQPSSTIGLANSPTAPISTSTRSPGRIHSGGVRLDPTPPGVPVAMTSPALSGVNAET